MKKLIIISTLFIYSCGPKIESSKHVEQKHFQLDLPNTRVTIAEYTIDECQYLGDLGCDGRSNYLTHKGNCTNPVHNK
jgi:hypothetical protein